MHAPSCAFWLFTPQNLKSPMVLASAPPATVQKAHGREPRKWLALGRQMASAAASICRAKCAGVRQMAPLEMDIATKQTVPCQHLLPGKALYPWNKGHDCAKMPCHLPEFPDPPHAPRQQNAFHKRIHRIAQAAGILCGSVPPALGVPQGFPPRPVEHRWSS